MQKQMIFSLLLTSAFPFLAFHPASHSTEALPHLPDGVSFFLYLLFTFIPTILQPYHIFQTASTLENRSQLTPLSTIDYPCKNRLLPPFPHFCFQISPFTLPPTLQQPYHIFQTAHTLENRSQLTNRSSPTTT